MNYSFITKEFENEIYINVIQTTFNNLNSREQQLLNGYLVDIVDIICIKFCFDENNKSIYEQQFRQNNYRDLKGLLLMLLPFIDGDKSTIRTLNDIYIKKIDNTDINESSPEYVYSNLQYNRCIRDNPIRERHFEEEHLEHNSILLKNTIQTVSNKLFVNWVDVTPIVTDGN